MQSTITPFLVFTSRALLSAYVVAVGLLGGACGPGRALPDPALQDPGAAFDPDDPIVLLGRLNQPYGGLTSVDEVSDFDDERLRYDPLLAEEGERPACSGFVCDASSRGSPYEASLPPCDGAGCDDAVCNGSECGTPDIAPRGVMVSVVWGNLVGKGAALLNWQGQVVVDNAAVKVRQLIQFDSSDYIIRPREDPQVIEYASVTHSLHDGLLLRVVMHPSLGTGPQTPPIVTFDNPQFRGSLTIPSEGALSGFLPTGDDSAIAYHVFPAAAESGCRNGILSGFFTELGLSEDGRAYGELVGRLVIETGLVFGKVKGVWGERANGKKVLFAKVIDGGGSFKAIIAGSYRDGQLKGRYLNDDHEVTGVVFGFYNSSPQPSQSMFRARWSQGCGEAPNEGEVEFDDEANEEVEEALTTTGLTPGA